MHETLYRITPDEDFIALATLILIRPIGWFDQAKDIVLKAKCNKRPPLVYSNYYLLQPLIVSHYTDGKLIPEFILDSFLNSTFAITLDRLALLTFVKENA